MTVNAEDFNRVHAWSFRVLQIAVLVIPSVPVGWLRSKSLLPLYVVTVLLAVWLVTITYAEAREGRSVFRRGDAFLAEKGVKPLNKQCRNEWNDPYESPAEEEMEKPK